jgi:hypothetical protein
MVIQGGCIVPTHQYHSSSSHVIVVSLQLLVTAAYSVHLEDKLYHIFLVKGRDGERKVRSLQQWDQLIMSNSPGVVISKSAEQEGSFATVSMWLRSDVVRASFTECNGFLPVSTAASTEQQQHISDYSGMIRFHEVQEESPLQWYPQYQQFSYMYSLSVEQFGVGFSSSGGFFSSSGGFFSSSILRWWCTSSFMSSSGCVRSCQRVRDSALFRSPPFSWSEPVPVRESLKSTSCCSLSLSFS